MREFTVVISDTVTYARRATLKIRARTLEEALEKGETCTDTGEHPGGGGILFEEEQVDASPWEVREAARKGWEPERPGSDRVTQDDFGRYRLMYYRALRGGVVGCYRAPLLYERLKYKIDDPQAKVLSYQGLTRGSYLFVVTPGGVRRWLRVWETDYHRYKEGPLTAPPREPVPRRIKKQTSKGSPG
jgi:hypothetical protein